MSVFKIKKGCAEIRLKDRERLLHKGCVLEQDDMTDETVFSYPTKEDAIEELKKHETTVAYMLVGTGLSYYLVTEYWIEEECADGEVNIYDTTEFPLIWPAGSKVDEKEYTAIANIIWALDGIGAESLDKKNIQQEIFNNRITQETGSDHKDYIWYDHDYEDKSAICQIGTDIIIKDPEKIENIIANA